jgi:biotin carboxyl carrier protein
MKQVIVNQNKIFEWDDFPWVDAVEHEDGNYLLLHNQKKFVVKLLETDSNGRPTKVQVNGRSFQIKVKNDLDLLIDTMGLNSKSKAKMEIIQAPMPGLIVNILCETGQSVAKGDSLLVMEAMKMENIIKSPGNGIIHKIYIAKGQTVNKNQTLLEFI